MDICGDSPEMACLDDAVMAGVRPDIPVRVRWTLPCPAWSAPAWAQPMPRWMGAVSIRGRYRQAETPGSARTARSTRTAGGTRAGMPNTISTLYVFTYHALISTAVAQQTSTRPHSARSRGPNAGLLGTKPPIGHASHGARGNYLACEPVGWPHVEAQGRRRVTTACQSTNPSGW